MHSATSPKPHVLVLTYLYEPDQVGGGPIFTDLCHGLVERGLEVTARCAYPYYPEWRDKSGRNGLKVWRYEDRGVHVERFGLHIPRDPNTLLGRFLNEGSFFLSLSRTLLNRTRFDAVLAYSPLMASVAFGLLHRRLHRTPLWLNVQDLCVEAAGASGFLTGGVFRQWLQRVQAGMLQGGDVVSSISSAMVQRLREICDGKEVMLAPNWLHRSLAEHIGRLPSRVNHVPGQPVRLLYSGNVGRKQDLLRFCRILHASQAAFRFQIHGAGAQAGPLEAWIRAARDPRFTMGPLVDEAQLAGNLHEADLFVVTEREGSGVSFIPSKLLPAYAAGTPVLAVSDRNSPLGQEMRQYAPGPWMSWADADGIESLIRGLPDQFPRYRAWAGNALARADFYERDRRIDQITAGLVRLARRPLSAGRPTLQTTASECVEMS